MPEHRIVTIPADAMQRVADSLCDRDWNLPQDEALEIARDIVIDVTEAVDKLRAKEGGNVAGVAAQMVDTLRGVLMAVDQEKPYPWQGGALKQQIREDITAYELLALDA